MLNSYVLNRSAGDITPRRIRRRAKTKDIHRYAAIGRNQQCRTANDRARRNTGNIARLRYNRVCRTVEIVGNGVVASTEQRTILTVLEIGIIGPAAASDLTIKAKYKALGIAAPVHRGRRHVGANPAHGELRNATADHCLPRRCRQKGVVGKDRESGIGKLKGRQAGIVHIVACQIGLSKHLEVVAHLILDM